MTWWATGLRRFIRKITSVSFHKMKLFGCVFNGVKLRHTQTRHILTGGPSPASAGSSGAKISRFVLHMAMKNNTVVAPLENFYWHAPTAELTDFIGLTSHHEHGELKMKMMFFVAYLRRFVIWLCSMQFKVVGKEWAGPGGRGASAGFPDTGCWHDMWAKVKMWEL